MAVHWNDRGFEEILKSAGVAAATNGVAEQVAANVRAQGIRVGDRDGGKHEDALPVEVKSSTTDDMRNDRVKASVVLAHASGQAVQAKHGALTRAAAEAGLNVKGAQK